MTVRAGSGTAAPIRFYRAVCLMCHLLAGLFEVALLFPLYRKARCKQAVRRWSARLLAILNVLPLVRGSPPSVGGRPAVMVANHVSWLDIHLIHCLWQVRFVAKSEVRRWPLIGWLSAHTGTLFIERGKGRHAARINQAIHAALLQGDAIGIFPEGTTSDGRELMRFHASLLQPAVDEGALVYPVALRYLDEAGNINVKASYVGETSLLESMRMIFAEKAIRAELIFLAPIEASGKTRRELAVQTHEAIAAALNLPASDRKPGISAGPPGAPR
ncbi:MAG: lysophospholipid acyltransferase family protein [Betaproteobacteria bacterium]|jgi:1-acyl-sn-glycerol-3-phosphate acyltransferase